MTANMSIELTTFTPCLTDDVGIDDGSLSTDSFTKQKGTNSTKCTSDIVDGSDQTAHCGVCYLCSVPARASDETLLTISKHVLEPSSGQDATKQTFALSIKVYQRI